MLSNTDKAEKILFKICPILIALHIYSFILTLFFNKSFSKFDYLLALIGNIIFLTYYVIDVVYRDTKQQR